MISRAELYQTYRKIGLGSTRAGPYGRSIVSSCIYFCTPPVNIRFPLQLHLPSFKRPLAVSKEELSLLPPNYHLLLLEEGLVVSKQQLIEVLQLAVS